MPRHDPRSHRTPGEGSKCIEVFAAAGSFAGNTAEAPVFTAVAAWEKHFANAAYITAKAARRGLDRKPARIDIRCRLRNMGSFRTA